MTKKRVRQSRRCPWCKRLDPRLDHNYNCKKCGRVVLAHWCKVEKRNEIERPLHMLCLCPQCAVKLGIIRVIKYGTSTSYEWIGEKLVLDTDWGKR